MIWLTSDHHLSHNNILKFCPGRQYKEIWEMNAKLVEEWNKLVQPDDIVYYLGDFSMNFSQVRHLVNSLNGKKILVPGNHDEVHPVNKKCRKDPEKQREIYLNAGFSEIHLHSTLFIEELGITVNLSHMPYKAMEPGPHGDKYENYRLDYDPNTWLLHGHVHQHWKVKENMINVGIDAWSMKPVSLDQIVELIKVGPQNQNAEGY